MTCRNEHTKLPVLGVKDVGGVLRHSGAEERAEHNVRVGQLNVGEDTQRSLCRCRLAMGSIIGLVGCVTQMSNGDKPHGYPALEGSEHGRLSR